MIRNTRDASYTLYQIYKEIGSHKVAAQMYQLYTASLSTILSETNQKSIVKHQMLHEFTLRSTKDQFSHAAEAAHLDAEKTIVQLSVAQYENRTRAIAGAGIVILLIGGMTLALDTQAP